MSKIKQGFNLLAAGVGAAAFLLVVPPVTVAGALWLARAEPVDKAFSYLNKPLNTYFGLVDKIMPPPYSPAKKQVPEREAQDVKMPPSNWIIFEY